MSKQKASIFIQTLSTRQAFWNKVVADVEKKLEDARKRVADLECARTIFKRNVAKDAPIPAGESTAAEQLDLHQEQQQHSV